MNYFCFLFCLLFTASLYAQTDKSFTVEYKLKSLFYETTLPDSIQENGLAAEIHLRLKHQMDGISYDLKVNDSISEFEIGNKILSFGKSDNWLLDATKNDRFYVDDNEYIQQRTLLEQEYLIKKPSYKQEWTLVEETKEILGYTCYKATRTINDMGKTPVIAWYAPDLPFAYGPLGHHGLPGLILEIIQKEKLIYYATEIDFESDVYVFKPSTGYEMSQEDFNNKLNFLIEDFPKRN